MRWIDSGTSSQQSTIDASLLRHEWLATRTKTRSEPILTSSPHPVLRSPSPVAYGKGVRERFPIFGISSFHHPEFGLGLHNLDGHFSRPGATKPGAVFECPPFGNRSLTPFPVPRIVRQCAEKNNCRCTASCSWPCRRGGEAWGKRLDRVAHASPVGPHENELSESTALTSGSGRIQVKPSFFRGGDAIGSNSITVP